MPRPFRIIASGICLALLAACDQHDQQPLDYAGPVADWPAYGAAPGGGHYSAATQINRDNVHQLQKAWEYRNGDFRAAGAASIEMTPGKKQPLPATSWQMTPILVDGTLYGCSSFNKIFALDPATGQEKWHFNPGVDGNKDVLANCRGVSHWASATPIRTLSSDHRLNLHLRQYFSNNEKTHVILPIL